MSNVTIQLKDKTARKLTKLAREQGKTLAEYLQEVAETQAKSEVNGTVDKRTIKEKLRAFDKWVASFPKRPGVKLDDSRETIYEGRGE